MKLFLQLSIVMTVLVNSIITYASNTSLLCTDSDMNDVHSSINDNVLNDMCLNDDDAKYDYFRIWLETSTIAGNFESIINVIKQLEFEWEADTSIAGNQIMAILGPVYSENKIPLQLRDPANGLVDQIGKKIDDDISVLDSLLCKPKHRHLLGEAQFSYFTSALLRSLTDIEESMSEVREEFIEGLNKARKNLCYARHHSSDLLTSLSGMKIESEALLSSKIEYIDLILAEVAQREQLTSPFDAKNIIKRVESSVLSSTEKGGLIEENILSKAKELADSIEKDRKVLAKNAAKIDGLDAKISQLERFVDTYIKVFKKHNPEARNATFDKHLELLLGQLKSRGIHPSPVDSLWSSTKKGQLSSIHCVSLHNKILNDKSNSISETDEDFIECSNVCSTLDINANNELGKNIIGCLQSKGIAQLFKTHNFDVPEKILALDEEFNFAVDNKFRKWLFDKGIYQYEKIFPLMEEYESSLVSRYCEFKPKLCETNVAKFCRSVFHKRGEENNDWYLKKNDGKCNG